MSLIIENVTKRVSVNTANSYMNLPVQNGISRNGHWYVYVPADANNATYGANVRIYQWSSNLNTGRADSSLTMTGTMALIREPWQGANNTFYHGGNVENIGAGVNDITGTVETDAFFFDHVGSLSPATDDDAFYWDRAYTTDGTDWEYYEYHKHLPTFYSDYESGRAVLSGNGFIRPADKAFASMINIRVKVGGTNYQSVLARIHTPSVGGAHNSHNDVTLPATGNKNYQMGGILKGAGDRYHAFYIAANGADWDLFTRTYVDITSSFSAEVNLGTFNFADPTLTSSNNHSYPVRASAGDYFPTTSRIYFPIIKNNATSGYDLEVWSYTSLNTIAGGTKLEYPLLSGVPVLPDMQILTVGQIIYGLVANTTFGGVDLYEFDGAIQTGPAQVITNGSSKYLRVHGFRYNPTEVKFYALISGESDSTGNYTGPGMYTWNLGGTTFTGYRHLDYDSANNAFISKNALANGYLQLSLTDGSLTKFNTAEPQGIASGTRILQYELLEPDYFNRTEITLKQGNSNADEFIYHGIELEDNRKLLAGRIDGLPYGKKKGDLLFSLVSQDNSHANYFAYGGIDGGQDGDDYVTGVYQSNTNPNRIWFTGYTKSEMVRKRDIKIHGYCRNTSDSPNLLEWRDIVTDTDGNIYVVGTSGDEVVNIFKYSPDYVLLWEKQLSYSGNITGNKLTLDRNNNLYAVGTVDDGTVLVAKLDSNGSTVWVYTYEVTGQTKLGTGIATVVKSSVEYIVVSAVEGTGTIFLILDTNGDIIEQNSVANLKVERVRNHASRVDGRFLFAGSDGASNGKFGMCQILNGTRMVQWTSTFGEKMYDISNIDGGATPGYIVCGVASSNTNSSIIKVQESEAAGVYTINKIWSRNLANSSYYGLVTTPYTETDRFIFAVGKTPTGGTAAMGMDEGIIVKYNNDGGILWQNVYGHDMDERLNSVAIDYTGENIISAGWSESHTSGRDAIIFRSEMGGFGTGTYHLAGNAGVPYYYLKSTLTDSNDANSITNLTAPSDSSATFTKDNTKTFTSANAGSTQQIFDGAYGENGLFMLHFGYLDLKEVQNYYNSEEYKQNQLQGKTVNYTDSVFNFWQIATAGDGAADDGNVFGYDIIEASDGTVYMIGQTSGDLTKTNEGASGVYDYILVKFDPVTEAIEIYQNGTSLDEETYSLTEMNDGRIAFTGRTTGALGDPNLGGYDIFLGIYNPVTETFQYESYGTGFNDRGLNLHDIGSGNLMITYTTAGDLTGANNTIQPDDVGLIKFNYNANTWGTAYQTASGAADLMDQNGKHSALLPDGRIALIFSTGGIFDESGVTFGALDAALAVWDPVTETFTKAQLGSQSSEIMQSVSAKGDRLLAAGFISDSWGNAAQGIYVEIDTIRSFGGKEAAAAE